MPTIEQSGSTSTKFVKSTDTAVRWDEILTQYLIKLHDDGQEVSTLRAHFTTLQNLEPKEYEFTICILELHLLTQRRLQ